ncbi:vWA domain-containing protein [Agrobacterium cavarae]|uniref:vWA domain-containing protein n=1 Tax=Agrobacterium cavarae TaxID=2528239 RepID=UPI00289898FF|nr:TadE/TadG family type IV pilus assembly protein [Agrobacterium cavarae]
MMMGRTFKRLLADKRGNFAILTALGLPVLFGAVGAGMETTRVMQVKNDMQIALDSAVLAAATNARLEEGRKTDAEYAAEVKKFVENYSTGGLDDGKRGAGEGGSGSSGAAGGASGSGNGKGILAGTKNLLDKALGKGNGNGADKDNSKKDKAEVDAVASRNDTKKGTSFNISGSLTLEVPLNPLIGFIGIDTVKITVTSTAQSSFSKGAALSLYLVLDRSGSMAFMTDTIDKSKKACDNYTEKNWPRVAFTTPCYIKKMASLQAAVSYLVDTLNKADPSYKEKANPESEFIRTGAVAYNSATFSAQKLDWGTTATENYVNAIPAVPTGGTNAYPALKIAFDALKSANPEERKQHDAKSNKMFQRFIVFMTDGEMTDSNIDGQVRTSCAAIKADGIKIFTVAFMAPDKGKSLLKYCASSPENYYDPENMEEIVAAFGEIARKAASIPTRLTN